MSDEFAKRLKETRTSMKLTLAEFADLGDVSTTSQGVYEKENEEERRSPDVKYLLNLLRNGIDIYYLLFGEKRPDNIIDGKTIEIINAYETADSVHKLAFEALAKASITEKPSRIRKKDNDDEPPPSMTNKNKMKKIKIGGDMMQNSNKSTIHNYSENSATAIPYGFNLSEKEKVCIHQIERAVNTLNIKENFFKIMSILAITLISLFIMKELGAITANNFGEEILSLIITLLLPFVTWVVLFKLSFSLINKLYESKRANKIRFIALN